jgi:lysophospholipase L1-like esterase
MLITKNLDSGNPAKLKERTGKIRVVCVGDSITGADLRGPLTAYGSDDDDFEGTVEITEFGSLFEPIKEPISRTYKVITEEGHKRYYPFQLEGLLGEEVANLGFAMEASYIAPVLVKYGLENFRNSKVFVIGFGTNDFGIFTKYTAHILSNFQAAYELLEKDSKQMVLLGIPPVCGRFVENPMMQDIPTFCNKPVDESYYLAENEKRRAHNEELESFCLEREVPYVDLSDMKDEHFLDPIHPRYIGAEFIAKKVYGVVSPLLRTI